MRIPLIAAALVLLGGIVGCVYAYPPPPSEGVVIVQRPWKRGDCWQQDGQWYCRGYDRHHGDQGDQGEDDDD